MKLLIVAFVVALGLLAPGPVAAQSMDACRHDATIASVRACVQHAAAQGAINKSGIVRGLLAELDAAQAALDRGQPAVAVAILEATTQEVDAQAGVHIAAEHAAHLTMHLDLVIAALSPAA